MPGIAGEANAFGLTGGQPGGVAIVRFGTAAGSTPFTACPGVMLGIAAHRPLGRASLDESGNALFLRNVPLALAGHTLLFQAVDVATMKPVLHVSGMFGAQIATRSPFSNRCESALATVWASSSSCA